MREDRLQLWGGLECTVNRVGDRYHDQFAKGGHFERPEDLDRIAELGIETLRYPVLWERTAPDDPHLRDWAFADERLHRIESLGIEPIVGLVHHGGGPRYTSLLDDGFASGLAEHARAVAERFPWVDAYTPVNEPLTTARFSALYGHWYPHATDGRSFARALVNQVRATILSMEAIRRVNPRARLVQTDDLGKTHATRPLRYQADHDNERRWLGWDLLCGRVGPDHLMWPELLRDGVEERQLGWLLENACPPDVIGVNYYLTSERFLDHRIDRYPTHAHGQNAFDQLADVEAVRALASGIDGPGVLLREAWERYGLPLAITECHLGCTREEQVRWLRYVWNEARSAREGGVDVRAVTVWSMFGAHDWCSLLTCERNRYEPGVFDLRAPEPRPTALAGAVAELAAGRSLPEAGAGWWERPARLLYPPVLTDELPAAAPSKAAGRARPPLMILGEGLLARAFARLCELRGLEHIVLDADAKTLRAATLSLRPWAVVDASLAPGVPGDALDRARLLAAGRLVAFSGPGVFDGRKAAPYVESDPVGSLDSWEHSLERAVLEGSSGAMLVRTGPLFDDVEGGSLATLLRHLGSGIPHHAATDVVLSPTYVPDLVHATLDLLIDGVSGIVHLANEGAVSPAELARRVADEARLDRGLVVDVAGHVRSTNAALASERAWIMPTLDDALARSIPRLVAEPSIPVAPYLS